MRDMMEAKDLRKSAESEVGLDEDDDAPIETPGPLGKLPPWARKLGARALVVGVNYLQGWLAWQAVQRAAIERERQTPKFPLF